MARAADADLVVIAIPFIKVPELAGEVPDWSGRVVVDATNQFAQVLFFAGDDDGEPADVLELVEFRAPAPGPGQVLVEFQAATINASDFLYISSRYFITRYCQTAAARSHRDVPQPPGRPLGGFRSGASFRPSAYLGRPSGDEG